MSENIKRIGMALMLICVVWLLFINYNINRRLDSLDLALQTVIINQTPDMHTMLSDIYVNVDSLKEEINNNTKLSFNETMQISSYNIASLSSNIKVSFNLKEYSAGDGVSITIRGMSGQIYSAEAILSETGEFSADLEIPILDSYVLSFITRGPTIRSGELAHFNLANDLCDRFKYSFSYSFSGSDYQTAIYSLNPYLSQDAQGSGDMTVDEIRLILESGGGGVIASVDLTPFLQTNENYQFIDTDSVMEQLQFTVGNGQGQLIPDENIVARIVINDHLGIRYEQTDQFQVQNIQNQNSSGFFSAPVGGGGAGGGGAGAAFVSNPTTQPRIIDEGEYSWGHISIVDTRR